MASVVQSGYGGVQFDHVVPGSVDLLKNVETSSVLTSRTETRLPPQTGSILANAANQQIQFILSSGSQLLDPNATALTFKGTTTGTGGSAFDEGASMIRRLQLSCGGILLEDIDYCGKIANAQVLASASQAWYKTYGSFANFWKHNDDLSWGTAKCWGDVSGNYPAANARHTAGQEIVIPLSLLSGFFRSRVLLPLFACGEIVITITFASNAEALVQRANTDATYNLSDIYLVHQLVTPSPAYLDSLNRYTQNESEPGLTIPYEAMLVTQTSATQATNNTFIVSKAANNLRRVIYLQSPTAALSALGYPVSSTFPKFAVNSIQTRVGGMVYPQMPSQGYARMFTNVMEAFGGEATNLGPSSCINIYTYNSTTPTTGNPANDVAKGSAATANTLWAADSFLWGYCYDNFKNSSDPLSYDGLNVMSSAGSQVQILVNYASAPSESVTPTIGLASTRFAFWKNGGFTIQGV